MNSRRPRFPLNQAKVPICGERKRTPRRVHTRGVAGSIPAAPTLWLSQKPPLSRRVLPLGEPTLIRSHPLEAARIRRDFSPPRSTEPTRYLRGLSLEEHQLER